MNNEEFQTKFERLLVLLGIATSIILSKERPKKDSDKEWWMKAIREVVYENKPIPSLREDD